MSFNVWNSIAALLLDSGRSSGWTISRMNGPAGLCFLPGRTQIEKISCDQRQRLYAHSKPQPSLRVIPLLLPRQLTLTHFAVLPPRATALRLGDVGNRFPRTPAASICTQRECSTNTPKYWDTYPRHPAAPMFQNQNLPILRGTPIGLFLRGARPSG